MRAATLLSLLLALACGSEGTETTSGEPATGSSSSTPPTTNAVDPEHPSGQDCPLQGLFVECEGGGRTYCDNIDAVLRFGPCIDEVACDISGSATCEMHCELVDGVPTWISDEAGCQTSGATDSG